MKAAREHWCQMPLYHQMPATGDEEDFSQPICHLFARSMFHPSTVHQRGLCGMLDDT